MEQNSMTQQLMAEQINQLLDGQEKQLTLLQVLTPTLAESMQNVLNVQLKKQQDLIDSIRKLLDEESKKSREMHEEQLKKLKTEINSQMTRLQNNTESLIDKLKNTVTEDVVDNCKAINKEAEKNCRKITDDAEEKINESLINIFIPLKEETEKLKKLRFTDFLRSFAACIVLSVFMLLAANYSVAYMKGMNKARSEVTEILEIEREKIKEEAIAEYKLSTQFLRDANGKRADIRKQEIEAYKNTDDYLEDACKLVAQNIKYIKCGYYLHKYMQSSILNEYSEIKTFDEKYLKRGWQQYKDEQKKK